MGWLHFCVPGGCSFEWTFHCHSCTNHCVIVDGCRIFLNDAMNEEIIETIKEKLKGEYSDADIKNTTMISYSANLTACLMK